MMKMSKNSATIHILITISMIMHDQTMYRWTTFFFKNTGQSPRGENGEKILTE